LQRVADPTRDVYQRADHELNDGGSDDRSAVAVTTSR
jgi:hypothetical protein